MKTIILAGGFGTRLAEETTIRPKPLVEIGGKPILWHLMNIYSKQGFNEFIIALGYRADDIKKFFLDYSVLESDLRIDFNTRNFSRISNPHYEWMVNLIDTGLTTQTGGRIKRLERYIDNETFMATYADGLSNIDLSSLLNFHRSHGKLATVTAVRPPSRFGKILIEDQTVVKFSEKSPDGDGWINGGFYIFEPEIFDYIEGDDTVLERGPMERLVSDGQLMAYHHNDFWQMMDNIQEKLLLERYWESGNAPWMEKAR